MYTYLLPVPDTRYTLSKMSIGRTNKWMHVHCYTLSILLSLSLPTNQLSTIDKKHWKDLRWTLWNFREYLISTEYYLINL